MTQTENQHTETVTRKDILAFTWYYWRQNKKLLFSSYLLIILAVVADSFFPILVGNLIDSVTQEIRFTLSWNNPILKTFLLFLVVQATYHLLRYITYIIWIKFNVSSLYSILNDSLYKVQIFSTDWHANSFAGGTVRKITRGMWAFNAYDHVIFGYICPTLVMLIVVIGLLLIKLPTIGLLTLAIVCIYIGISVFLSIVILAPRFIKSAYRDTQVGSFLADSITANSTVKSFGREQEESHSFLGITQKWKIETISAWQTNQLVDFVRRLMAWGMMGAMLFTALCLWEKGEVSAGDVVFVITSYLVISAYLRNIGEQISNLQKAISEMEDVIYFWKREDKVKDQKGALPLFSTKGHIAFQQVDFSYEGQSGALYKEFSLTIKSGEHVALVGPSGSGKSTFVKLVQRLYDVQGGEILIDGHNIAHVTQRSLRQTIALVPQDPILFHRPLADNIAYGRPEATQDEIMEAAKQAYAHDFISTLPQGYDTLVGERGVKLSGGERQRVAIARAILADSSILILDEATSSLDSVSEHEVQKALTTLTQGKTTITIAHRLATIKAVDRILVFEKGRIVEQGTHDVLVVTEGSHYKRLFEMQALDLVGE